MVALRLMARINRDLPTYRRQGTWKKVLRNALVFLLVMYLGLGFTESFFLRGQVIRSSSMEPGISAGDRVLMTPVVYGKVLPLSDSSFLDFSLPSRGDLVQVLPPYTMHLGPGEKFLDSLLRIVTLGRQGVHPERDLSGMWESSPVLRRVIGLPGDQVMYSAGTFLVRRQGETEFRDENSASGRNYRFRTPETPELSPGAFLSDQSESVTVPAGKVFLACDNRTGFTDSRAWGSVPVASLRGYAFLRVWPLGEAGFLR